MLAAAPAVALSLWQFGTLVGAGVIAVVLSYMLGFEDGKRIGRLNERAWRAEQDAQQASKHVAQGLRLIGGGHG